MNNSIPKVAVIGAGYWGRNLVRNFHELGALGAVCDTRDSVRREMEEKFHVRTVSNVEEIFADSSIQAVVIAAPAAQHYELTKAALEHDKDVYVEKPLALNVRDGQDLVSLAKRRKRILMVGHILEYHPAIVELKKLIREGALGRIRYIYSSRLNIGKLRTEENILWSFAPHDISAILSLLAETPEEVATHGGSYLDPQIVDTTMTTCSFKSGVKAHIFVSWLHPFKEQKLSIVGGKNMAVFDDTSEDRKLVLYPHRIDWQERVPTARKEEGVVVPLPKQEPLRNECAHFLECVEMRQTPRTDGENGLQVLRVLDACERSLRESGRNVALNGHEPNYFAHPSAVIDKGCEIGEGTKIWHFTHIMAGSKLGKNCNLGQNVVISPKVQIGNNVKIQNNVSVYEGVELEDDVFCGPSMVFTNVMNPRSHVSRKHEYRPTLIRQGASIGANATIVCGTTLGRYSFVGSGAVVTRDVPDYALVVGVPARQIGWVCNCGVRLKANGAEARCEECGKAYHISPDNCREVTTQSEEPRALTAAL